MFNPLKWLPGKDIDDFSRKLARDLASRYSVEAANGRQDKKSEKKLGRALKRVYGTARLGNTFKWELKEMGYETAFIEEATKGLILSVRGR